MPEVLTFKIEDFEGPLDLLPYLVGKNKMNLYDVNIMELIEQYTAAIREMQEETGLTIRNPRLVSVKQFPIEAGRYVVLLFKAVEWSGTLTSSEEGEMAWIEYSKLPSLQTVDDLEEMLHMMNTPELTEFQYLLRGDEWIMSIK